MMNYYAKDNVIQYSYSEKGQHHIIKDEENQDSIFVGQIDSDTFCLAVADGVSSCRWAKKGSLAAVDTICHLAVAISEGTMESQDIDGIRRYVVRDWKNHFQSDWNDYGTTLNFAVVHKNDLVVGQIGDGLLLLRNGDENINITDMDEFYSAETYALSEVVLKSSFNVIYTERKGTVAIFAMTDGIGKEIEIEQIEEFKESLIKLMKLHERDIESEIREWISLLNEKNNDDKSIGMLILEE